MAEYIDREKLLRDIDHYHVSDGAFQHWVEIQNVVDVAPVVHGHWMSWEEMFPEQTPRKKNNLGVFCSECNSHNDTRRNYCPECGADMRGGNDE